MKGRPVIVLCHTIKGKGIPFVENFPTKPNILLTENEYAECLAHLDGVERVILNGSGG